MSDTTSIAEQVAARLGDDGMLFTSESGEDLAEVCESMGGEMAKGRTRYDDERDCEVVEPVARGEQIFDLIRYEFDDGSAIVIAGEQWDIEGDEPFSWAGA